MRVSRRSCASLRLIARTPRPAPPANPVDQLIETLRRDFGGPRVLAFANPKGGVHKTTACVLTAATLGSARGKGVLAWDDNELRGTLGLRAGTARHARTVRHLLADLPEVEASGPHLAERLDDVPGRVDRACRRPYAHASDPARQRLNDLLGSSDLATAHLGPDALTYLSIIVDDTPPGYPREVQVACIARQTTDGWQSARRPHIDFALDGRPAVTLPSPSGSTNSTRPP